MSEAKRFLTTIELAEELGVHPLTLIKWRRERRGPAFVKLGKTVRYDRVLVDAWVAESMQVPVAA